MITLQIVTSKNCFAIFDLKADEKHVAANQRSMAEAYAYYAEHGFGPIAYGIYNDEMPVGFIMAVISGPQLGDEDLSDGKPYYYLWRMMIDNDHQSKGYGRAALHLLLQEIKKFPQGKADKMFTSVVPGNTAATRLYESFGFEKTGEVLDGEEVMELVL